MTSAEPCGFIPGEVLDCCPIAIKHPTSRFEMVSTERCIQGKF